MIIHRDWLDIPDSSKGAVLAIGNFDGLHVGHREVLRIAQQLAQTHNAPLAVMSFEPHPRDFFQKYSHPHRIEPFHTKARQLRDFGVNIFFALRFNQKFASIEAADFIQHILSDSLQVKHIVTGEDFSFGFRRAGNGAMLQNCGLFDYTIVPAVKILGEICSSSRVRNAISSGDMCTAQKLLSRPYQTSGRVTHGEKRGRLLGFPTANIYPSPHLLNPAFGVYAAKFSCVDEKSEIWHEAVANFGTRPTFNKNTPLLEIHGLDLNKDLYGKKITVQWLKYLRAEKNFSGVEELKAQIGQDIEQAKKILA